MAEPDSQDRNLPASQKKIERSRREGQMPRSRDLPHFAVIATGGALLSWSAPRAVDTLQRMLEGALRFDAEELRTAGMMTERLSALTWQGAMLCLPALLILAAAAIAAHLAGGGWNFTMKPLTPKFDHLNPITGIGRLFQWQQLTQALKACALALVLGIIGGLALKDRVAGFVGIMSVPLPAALAFAGKQLMGGLSLLGLALALFAIIDVPLQRHLYLKRLKMSREEAKNEMKEAEGNLEMKHRMRAKARELVKRRMLAAVPKADLVVMNPSHYAVAIAYDETKMGAPRVVAKGLDLLAFKIRDIAKDNKVPVLRAPALARALYAHAELDREIPGALFGAVAQVLAYVYQLKAAMAGRGLAPQAVPNPPVPDELDPHKKPGWTPPDEEQDDLLTPA
ncbi:EscU/YscU/HrcU family type III secretion system export apparatus switch protein [Roseateles amylovorans]|uniref:Flagellar type III secretion system protein FlhB n=1 Tax=Roseateles amylovorans TaxID=2978473 RepID=A0ABY6B3Q1_9BURK|nr:flagellar type III secretion system protein FlhB [Roseateles amylovorans]UXH79810.1 flagellar type III secretion system protein FlhB [Roseateles amylovorans]